LAESNHGDAAAIMIGAGAVGYAVFSRDGMYEAYDSGIAAGIAIVLIAYIWPSVRTRLQSAAIAILLGGCAVPIVGYLVILGYNPLAHGYCNGLPNHACADPWNDSPADNIIGTVSWIVFGLVAYFLDRSQNQTR
jgi:hypothetical protein